MKLTLAAIWMVGVVAVIAMSGYLRSISDVLLLGALVAGPPASMWLWWDEPAQTASQPIQTVHGNGASRRPRSEVR
jgi:hypothetical protein